jgi:hypothetical protein
MHTRIAAFATTLLATTALAVIPVATASASAGVTASQIITELSAIGAGADAAGTATNLVTSGNALTTGPAANAAWQPITSDIANANEALTGTGQQFASSDENAILTAYTSTVTHLQSALAVAVAQSGVIVQAGQAQPFAATFNGLESTWDAYGFALISADPDIATQLQTQKSALESSAQQAISAYTSS